MRITSMNMIRAYEYQKKDQNGYTREMHVLKDESPKKQQQDSVEISASQKKVELLRTGDGSVTKVEDLNHV